MPSFCAVINCNDRYGHSENISFHKFPLKRIDLLKQWEAFIQTQRGPDWHASRWSSLCSRHFRDDDFRSLNERKTLKKSAVPSIMLRTDIQTKSNKYSNDFSHAENNQNNDSVVTQGITERSEDHGNVMKNPCRLCGINSIPAGTFHSNYTLLGILQKCLPCLNVQEDDLLPKTLCDGCLKTLQQFGNFVDKVLEAQKELQRKYRHRTTEKVLKIKQEPVVRVKQEIAEADNYQESQHNDVSFINTDDYDCNGEQLPDTTSDQKYELCDFPIINDCDIMEIINLDDPFINIPDDDNTTSLNIESESQQHSNRIQPIADNNSSIQQQHTLSAHDLLQSHLLMEEHNYAYLETEEFKEEHCFYKTEKTEGYEQNLENHVLINGVSSTPFGQGYEVNCNTNNTIQPENQSAVPFTNDDRSLKPIVTSVSAIQQPSRSNGIVVLDESIVKSSIEFQLHTCMVCQMKFFSIEALRQHYTQTHGTPMVSVPHINLQEVSPDNTCKMENEINEANIGIPLSNPNNDDNNLLESIKPVKTNGCYQVNNIIANQKIESPPKRDRKKLKMITKMKPGSRRINCNLNIMASNYQQLKKLYHKLQRKCKNLEQNVEQLQSQPKTAFRNTQRRTADSQIRLSKVKKSCTSRLTKKLKFECVICLKVFNNANSLRQHKITHTEDRPHTCGLCSRSFKRRNGLLQHFKGYHLQVKPFSCGVCKHAYALKCDMLRCKHSILKNGLP